MTDHSALIDAIPTDLWIGGKQVPSSSGARFPVHNPANGAVLTTVADASAADGATALDEAVAAQPSWAATAPRERAEILRRAWELVMERRDDFALAMTLEMGKPLAESQGEVAYGGEFLRWFSEEAVRINGRYTSSPTGNGRILVAKQPIGPALAITPWNFPLAMGTRKIGPAFAAGCTMIVKPAAETPLTMLLLGQVFADAGLPAGVLSILPTTSASGLTSPLIEDSRLRKLTFTGSTAVGKVLLSQCATRVLRSSMELGGNAPFVVFDDADVDAAVDGAMAAKMRNIGEACTAANRFHVDNAVRTEFAEKLTARMGALTIGPGDQSGVQVGPLITAKQRASVDELVQDAVSKGAVITTGGAIADGEGYFYPPTVLTDVPSNARILREEVFGPVAAITGFDGEDAGVAAANDTEYGLAAYVYTTNLDRALRVSESVESGMIGVNRGVISDVAAPFGGIKESGIGREAGSEGIEEYLETKYIALP
ncbi:NAD-dependent succinate-semialdehyde dehydrogenase [Mycobacteroides chelonae]|uniref:NAD-dependent succinate-semialdehyde dehydrogenase n=1 Tax=Mycobacteroides chelonae TaxID=1774 RepID=A0AB73U7N8_MYCCH|nr:NAD-dependent succinate-semialdehyde dehydrogenase [Mycobacteroides chelonae]MEC4841924.1 NAD-dependent succinate-semialdehyde dehydrogenase [Mycobacteroides chelonae]MEC4846759.1 NAD-dependent succinate-semialdehyde dehydrogenase [Mycobacteroides chelonae]OHU48796.1 NAD-dependent succinate-semialdehyde dehydrogenase [Mycobacteroides chelonae]OLT79846.1 NAD-dependent succinate-semialdehyde dehydrogenase [Mycobacteroides chelonae]QDF72652.1 NAD-dependent succinate-semialdehyde dehydrogenase 